MEDDEKFKVIPQTNDHDVQTRWIKCPIKGIKQKKKNYLFEVVGMIVTSFQEFLTSKKEEEKRSDIEIHEIIFCIIELTDIER